jgi:hypothetical protein
MAGPQSRFESCPFMTCRFGSNSAHHFLRKLGIQNDPRRLGEIKSCSPVLSRPGGTSAAYLVLLSLLKETLSRCKPGVAVGGCWHRMHVERPQFTGVQKIPSVHDTRQTDCISLCRQTCCCWTRSICRPGSDCCLQLLAKQVLLTLDAGAVYLRVQTCAPPFLRLIGQHVLAT